MVELCASSKVVTPVKVKAEAIPALSHLHIGFHVAGHDTSFGGSCNRFKMALVM